MGRFFKRFSLGIIIFGLFAAPAWAADWTISQLNGIVWLGAPGQTAERAVAGELVPYGWYVATEANSRVLLVNGQETMAVAPNTIASIATRGRVTLVTQHQGEITFEVDQRDVRNFTVQTPVLAAVVKGTVFTVRVVGAGAEVDVDEGTVEVEVLLSGQTALFGENQRAVVIDGDPQLYVATPNGQLRAIGGPAQAAQATQEEARAARDQCKDGGWEELGYVNQGQCISAMRQGDG